jgi:hypothetical protein
MTRVKGMSPIHEPRQSPRARDFAVCVCGRKLRWNSTTKKLEHKR